MLKEPRQKAVPLLNTASRRSKGRQITLFFNKTPLAITVNNTPAVINGKQAKWTIPRNLNAGHTIGVREIIPNRF